MSLPVSSPGHDAGALARHYQRFRVAERCLLTGHSHQAWPDCAERGLGRAFDDAAEHVDDKWRHAFAEADRVRDYYRSLMGDPDGCYALGANTHELLLRMLSALPWRKRQRIVTTDGEFHSMRRQLARLQEEGIEVVRIAAQPAQDVGQRLAAAVTDATLAVFVSTVFYENAHVAGGIEYLADACRRHDTALVLDTYHQLGAVPFSLTDRDLLDCFAVGGGYKYLQLGEGNAFLRFPKDCELRPALTGWYAEFGLLTAQHSTGTVEYADGDQRFAGATYDPVSHYRATGVIDFFNSQGLTAQRLREVSRHQVGRLIDRFDALDIDPATITRDAPESADQLGGFLALRVPGAAEVSGLLRQHHQVFTDSRGDVLRLGPAPYLTDCQLDEAMAALGEVIRHPR